MATAKVHYSFGLDEKGRLVEVRINGKLVKLKEYKDRKCHKEYLLKVRFCEPEDPKEPKPIDACCLVDGGGTLWCWC